MSSHRAPRKAAPPAPKGLARNNTSFPTQASALLRKLHTEYVEAGPENRDAHALKYYQYLVRAVMTRPEYGIGESGNGRGLLIYHAMGMGKTLLAVACAMAMWDVRPPLVIAPKSLHRNFAGAVEKLTRMLNGDMAPARLDALVKANQARFRYVALDAHNMAKQVARATTGVEGAGSIKGRLLIVDEAHLFMRAVINSASPATNARQLYDMVMAARDVRILFLTGTPSSKNPFEMVPCFNMLAGEELLPVQYETFMDAYVDRSTMRLKNRGKLANRILGLVSHVSPSQWSRPPGKDEGEGAGPKPRSDGGFPETLEPKIIRIEMSANQYRRYLQAREQEEAERGGTMGGPGGAGAARIPRGSPALSLPTAASGTGSTYFNRSRNLSNFALDATQLAKFRDDPDVAAYPDAAFTAESSPKAAYLVAALNKGPAPALVYSQYVSGGGLAIIARFLEKDGWERWVPPGSAKRGGGAPAKAAAPKAAEARRRAALLDRVFAAPRCGTTTPELRAAIRETVERPRPFSMLVREGYPAGAVKYVTPRGMCRYDRLMNLHIGQRKLFLSELDAFARFLGRADAAATVVYAGAAGGNHLPLLASLFPRVEFHLYDPAPFRFKKHPRLHTYRQFFTDDTAREWAGRCAVFISDIRIAGAKPRAHEECCAKDMAAQARWTRLIAPTGGAVLKYRPSYWAAGDRDSKFPYLRGEVVWQLWAPPTSTEARLLVSAADARAPDVVHDGDDHQNRCFRHNVAVRPWARYARPASKYAAQVFKVPGYDGCFDCAGEARLWVGYLDTPGAVRLGAPRAGEEVAALMALLTRAARGVSLAPGKRRGPPRHGAYPGHTGPESVCRALGLSAAPETPETPTTGGAEGDADDAGDADDKGDGAPSDGVKRYAVISGAVSVEDRDSIVAAVSAPENRRGAVIAALLVSMAGALGIDLKNMRQSWKYEPYWDKALEDQVDARTSRLGSHDALPVEDRDVQSFLLIATANERVRAGIGKTTAPDAADAAAEDSGDKPEARESTFVETGTINETFHRRALNMAGLNEDMRSLLRESCLECAVNKYGNCRVCVPTDAPLFHADPERDLRLSDPCAPLAATEVEAAEITLGDRTFFYRADAASALGVAFYAYDAALEAHTTVNPATGLFHDLLKKWQAL